MARTNATDSQQVVYSWLHRPKPVPNFSCLTWFKKINLTGVKHASEEGLAAGPPAFFRLRPKKRPDSPAAARYVAAAVRMDRLEAAVPRAPRGDSSVRCRLRRRSGWCLIRGMIKTTTDSHQILYLVNHHQKHVLLYLKHPMDLRCDVSNRPVWSTSPLCTSQ